MAMVPWWSSHLFQLILNPIRDWNEPRFKLANRWINSLFQLILNPIRDWNENYYLDIQKRQKFQLILNPIRDWNTTEQQSTIQKPSSN